MQVSLESGKPTDAGFSPLPDIPGVLFAFDYDLSGQI